MPYSSTDELPEQTSKLSPKKKRQFMHVVNSALASGDSEESAFKQAWSAVSKEMYSWDVVERQLDQVSAAYSPTGGDGDKMCAGCQWFVSPDSCVVVMGTVSPTGVSNMFMAKEHHMQEPIPVTIVKATDQNKGVGAPGEANDEEEDKKKKKKYTMKDFASNLLSKFGLGAAAPPAPVQFFKQKDGRTRFFVVYSNQFKDRDASILTEAAHKEFENWVDTTGNYPELWVWHAKGSRIGETDWIHYNKGLACASGLVDADKESVVGGLDLDRLGVSHGFFAAATKSSHVSKYRTYELSVLPRDRAANIWTTVNLFKDLNGSGSEGEGVMAFNDAKRQFLVQQFGNEELVSQMERDTEQLAETLKAAGVEYKEVEEPNIGAEVVAMTRAFNEFATTMVAQVKELNEKVEAQSASLDEQFVKAWDSKLAELPKAFEASTAESTVVTGATKESPKDSRWLEEELNNAFGLRVN